MNNKDIGVKIKRLREANGLTQAKLATELGYKSNAVISKLENGESELTASQIKKLTKYFNVTSDFLLTDQDMSIVDNKSLQVTKTIKVKKSLSFFKRNDFIILGLIFIIIILAAIFKDTIRNNILIVLMIFDLLILIYFVIAKVIRSKENVEVVNLPLNKHAAYYSTLDDKVVKKYKKTSVISGLIVIFTNIVFYGIIINNITDKLSLTPYFLVVALLLIIIFKSVTFVLSSRFLEMDMTFLLLMVLMLELFTTTYYLLYLDFNNILNTDVVLMSAFNLIVFLVVIITNDMFLQKYNYKIE